MVYQEEYMKMAIKLAEKGRGLTSPNPMVGAVVVKNGEVLGKGWHQEAGGPHAEVAALQGAGTKAAGAEMYVSLEPCCHQGRTAPCTQAIIKAGIKEVYAAVEDINPEVSGKGILELKEAGIKASAGYLEDRARKQNEVFFKYMEMKQPFVTLKLALSLDGKMSDSFGYSKWITGKASRKETHRIRREQDAILVGIGTALADDPMLNVRLSGKKKNPVRVIIDRRARIQPELQIIKTADKIKTILAVTDEAHEGQIKELRKHGLIVEKFGSDKTGIELEEVLRFLGSIKITSLLVEGGAALATSFIERGLVDKYLLFYAADFIGGFGSKALMDKRTRRLDDRIGLNIEKVKRLDGDLMITAYPR